MNRHRQPHNFWSAKDKNKLHILKSISFGQIGIQELSSTALVCQEFRCEFECGGFCWVAIFSLSVVVKTGLICSIKVRGFVNLLIYILIQETRNFLFQALRVTRRKECQNCDSQGTGWKNNDNISIDIGINIMIMSLLMHSQKVLCKIYIFWYFLQHFRYEKVEPGRGCYLELSEDKKTINCLNN